MKKNSNEIKKLYSSMSYNEKLALINVMKNINLGEKSYHAKKEMVHRDITESMIENTWKKNHIIEFKVIDREKRLIVRGIDAYLCKYDICKDKKKIYVDKKELCNVCLVVNMENGDLITCYSSPIRLKNAYVNNRKKDESYDYEMNVLDYL
jgi:hypothetical protein